MKTLVKLFFIALFPCVAFAGPEQLIPFAGMYNLVNGTKDCPVNIKMSVTTNKRYAMGGRPASVTAVANISFIKNVYDRYGRPIGQQPLNVQLSQSTFGGSGTPFDSRANIFITGVRNFTVTGYIQANGMVPLQFPYTFNVNGPSLRFRYLREDYQTYATCDYRDMW